MRTFPLSIVLLLLVTSSASFASSENEKKCRKLLVLDGTETLTQEIAPEPWDSAIRRVARNLSLSKEYVAANMQMKQGMPKIYLLDEAFISLDEEKLRAAIKNPKVSVWLGSFKDDETVERFYQDIEFEDGEYKSAVTMYPKVSFKFGQHISDAKSIHGVDKVLAQIQVIAPRDQMSTSFYNFLVCEKAGSIYTYFVPNPFIANEIREGILDTELHPFSEFSDYFVRRYLARIPHPSENQN